MSRNARPPAGLLAVALGALALAGCLGEGGEPVPEYEVVPARFEIGIGCFGELKAAQATPVQVPATLQGVQRIAWIADEGAAVREGDVVARLDDEPIQLQIRAAEDNLEQLRLQLSAKQRELERERTTINGQITLLETEKNNAERFAPRDPELFSRVEILEAEINLDLIETRMRHARERIARYTKRAEAELEIMGLRRRAEQVRLGQLREAAASLVMRAPHDGYFLRSTTWEGQRMRVGMTVWRSQQLGELPDTSRMQAKVWVLESEAAGLAPGLPARVTLDAHPDRGFEGEVKTVQPVANPIEPESPVKYFEVLIDLDETDTSVMQPGGRVRAKIWVDRRDDVLAVPNQAIFRGGSETFLWVRNGAGFSRRTVTLGARSVSRTVVEEGLAAGERVALVAPTGQAEDA